MFKDNTGTDEVGAVTNIGDATVEPNGSMAPRSRRASSARPSFLAFFHAYPFETYDNPYMRKCIPEQSDWQPFAGWLGFPESAVGRPVLLHTPEANQTFADAYRALAVPYSMLKPNDYYRCVAERVPVLGVAFNKLDAAGHKLDIEIVTPTLG